MNILQKKHQQAVEALEALLEKQKNGGKLSPDDERQLDGLMAAVEVLEAELEKPQPRVGELVRMDGAFDDPSKHTSNYTPSKGPEYWQDSNGKQFRVYRPGERIANPATLPEGIRPDEVSFGRFCRGLMTGNWTHAPAEAALMRAGSTGSPTNAGYLVPSFLSDTFIDLARSKLVMSKAGARFLPIQGETTIARLTGDATVAPKGENDSFSASDQTFDRALLVPRTYGVLVKISRELAEDGVNVDEIFGQTLAGAVAEKVDEDCLQGDGAKEMLGIINTSGVNTITSVGSPLWEDLLNAIKLCRIDDCEPNAYVCSPQCHYDLVCTYSGDGTNSAKNFMEPTEEIKNLIRLVTSSCPDANAIVGDFTKALIGMRQELLLEVSTEADTAFAAHQVWFKATLRCDLAVADPEAFCILSGIS